MEAAAENATNVTPTKTIYEVLMFNVPKVSEDGKQALPIPPHKTQSFDDLEKARTFAKSNKDAFERVLLVREDRGTEVTHALIERYRYGEFERAEDITRR